jgi:hypothetical protein
MSGDYSARNGPVPEPAVVLSNGSALLYHSSCSNLGSSRNRAAQLRLILLSFINGVESQRGGCE